MTHPPADLDRALKLHQSGQLGAAIAAYFELLPRQPANAHLLYLLGTALLQAGDLNNGGHFLQKSLALEPRNPSALNNLGIAAKDLKRFDEALDCFDKSIRLDPNQADAHNNRGAILKELDRLDEALASYDQAILARPTHAEAHNNRGNVLQKLARHAEALASYDQAIALRADFADAHANRGHTLHALQRPQEALACLDQAIALQPQRAESHVERALALRVLSRFDEALASLDRAIALNPAHAVAHVGQGEVLGDLKRFEPAVASFDRALALDPGSASTHSSRGLALKSLRRWDEALASFDRAIALAPRSSDPLDNKGHTLFVLGRLGEARACFEQAIALNPQVARSHANLGAVLQQLGLPDDALASYDRAIALDPASADGPWNKAQLLILKGEYAEGWALYEARLQKSDFSASYTRFPEPSWRGQERIAGKRIFIHSEQGHGDVIQFCRYLPLLDGLGAEVVFESPRPLMSFVSTLKCRMTVIAKGDPRPGFDVWCPLMSLPLAFGTTTSTIPAETPYLRADPAKVAAWRARLGPTTRPRVGLVWSGSPTHANDMNRSIGLDTLMPLLDLPVEWHALQKEFRAQDAATLDAHPEVRRHHDALADFSDTAALAECMDLVISVDTSVAHLAGAIGRPTWILLPFAPDYRWLLDRADSPWYPTARLFRQPALGDWAGVVAQVRERLRDRTGLPGAA